MASKFRRFTFVESATNPGERYEIKTDGTTLSCACPRWRFARGGTRDCRHIQEVRKTLAAASLSLAEAINFLDIGVDAVQAWTPLRGHDVRRAALRTEVETIFNTTPWRPSQAVDRVLALIEREARVFTDPPLPAGGRPAWLGGGRAILLRD